MKNLVISNKKRNSLQGKLNKTIFKLSKSSNNKIVRSKKLENIKFLKKFLFSRNIKKSKNLKLGDLKKLFKPKFEKSIRKEICYEIMDEKKIFENIEFFSKNKLKKLHQNSDHDSTEEDVNFGINQNLMILDI